MVAEQSKEKSKIQVERIFQLLRINILTFIINKILIIEATQIFTTRKS